MKRILCILFSAMFAMFAFAGCSKDTKTTSGKASDADTAKTDNTKDGSKPSDNGKASSGKPIAQRVAKSDGTAGTDTQALAKRDASKPTPEASSNVPKRQAENAKPHGKKAGAGDAKDTKNADSTKTAVTDAAKKNDDTNKASMKKKPSEPKHDSNGNNGASIVTVGNDKPQSPNEHKRPPVTPASQEDTKVTTGKPSVKGSTEHVDNHDVLTQHGKNDTVVPVAEKPRKQGAENKQTRGKVQQETVPPSHDNAGSTTEANIKPAIEQNIKPIAESGNAHDSKEVTADAPAPVKVSDEQHATAPKQDENKAGIGDDDKQNAKQPDIEQHTASDEPAAAAAASDAKPAERKAREASQKKTAKKQDVKQEDDATSHAAEQKVRKEQPVVAPSDDAESHDAAEKPAETSMDVAEHETVSENSVTEPDRMSCHDEHAADTVPAVTIDGILAGRPVSYLKFDVEGAEMEALEGGRESIGRFRPKLLIAGYHHDDDLWRIPLYLHSLCPDYRIYLRRHPYVPCWEINFFVHP